MFIKKIDKGTDIKKYTYYRLCESVRVGDKTRHNNLLNLGTLEGLDEDDRKNLANRIEALFLGHTTLFEVSDKVETLALKFYQLLRDKYKQSSKVADDISDFIKVDINTLEHDAAKEVGAEWLCYQAALELGLPEYFKSLDWSNEFINSVLLLIISRAVYPESEHATASWLDQSSYLSELIFGNQKHFSHNQLYKIGDKLFENHIGITNYLASKTNELFSLTDKIVFFDLTNTYFEGVKAKSEIAKFGRNKEKRKDVKLISLALVVNAEGFVKYGKVYEGNIYEGHTLLATVEALKTSSSVESPLIVMDAGISSEENLKMLREHNYHYLCVTRSKLKDYTSVETDSKPIEISDQRNNKIELKLVQKEGSNDTFMHVRSHKKALKEASMRVNYSERFEEELNHLSQAIHKPKGTKTIKRVYERLGRIKQRYPAAVKYYNIQITDNQTLVTDISFSKNALPEPKETDGVYFIRTSLPESDEKTIWTVYNTLTEIESTFRTLKTDLNLRPVHHQKDQRCEAHIHLGVLAYMIVNTIRHKLKLKNINHSWKKIVEIMKTQKAVKSSIKNDKNELIVLKKCTRPTSEVLEIYQATCYKTAPFNLIKDVVPQNIN